MRLADKVQREEGGQEVVEVRGSVERCEWEERNAKRLQ
jgi:hypothetical protein